MPPLRSQLANLAIAIVKHTADGFADVDEGTVAARLEACAGCEQFNGDMDTPRCNECGCFLRYKAKWRSEECPLGKWETAE